MSSDYEPNEKSNSINGKWVTDESTIDRYRYNGQVLGAIFGFLWISNIDLQCHFLKNSQGCGFDSTGQAIGISLFITVIMAILAGICAVEVAKNHPITRPLSTLLAFSFFILHLGWMVIFEWIKPLFQADFWNEKLGSHLFGFLLIVYFALYFHLNRRIKK